MSTDSDDEPFAREGPELSDELAQIISQIEDDQVRQALIDLIKSFQKTRSPISSPTRSDDEEPTEDGDGSSGSTTGRGLH
ncbi:MAG: hypothetical protein AAF661_10500 [Pseudomonadota bacterium]